MESDLSKTNNWESREQVHKAIEHFTCVFQYYIVESLKQEYGEDYLNVIAYGVGYNTAGKSVQPYSGDKEMINQEKIQYEGYKKVHPDNWDFSHCFTVFLKFWDSLFSKSFTTNIPKSYIFILKHFRNQWAHNAQFTLRDAYRVADTVQLFFEMINAPTDEISMIRLVVLDKLFAEEKQKILNGQANAAPQKPVEEEQDSGCIKRNWGTVEAADSFSSEMNKRGETTSFTALAFDNDDFCGKAAGAKGSTAWQPTHSSEDADFTTEFI
ncbi:unnamed protein product [Moneuplotes crassus]|uniref:Swt1-like HEPN domain-containing protein n=2 Tax=Euplotes crassus TaxID=5936 RepID=A0AAD1ULY3_EUPCR|nr:unnamed protein product [Moneuplotes crassus]